MISFLLSLIVITTPMPPEQLAETYLCAKCDYPLFNNLNKYESGNGWLSFSEPLDQKSIYLAENQTLLCSRCGNQIGHLFHDGFLPNEMRYSINPAAIKTKNQTAFEK